MELRSNEVCRHVVSNVIEREYQEV